MTMNRSRFCFPAALLLAVLVVVSVLLWGTACAQDKGKEKVTAPNVKWEYKVLQSEPVGVRVDADKMEKDLHKLGQDGWECVGTVSEVYGPKGGPNTTRALLICKRPKQ
jgi:hypothetical protein